MDKKKLHALCIKKIDRDHIDTQSAPVMSIDTQGGSPICFEQHHKTMVVTQNELSCLPMILLAEDGSISCMESTVVITESLLPSEKLIITYNASQDISLMHRLVIKVKAGVHVQIKIVYAVPVIIQSLVLEIDPSAQITLTSEHQPDGMAIREVQAHLSESAQVDWREQHCVKGDTYTDFKCFLKGNNSILRMHQRDHVQQSIRVFDVQVVHSGRYSTSDINYRAVAGEKSEVYMLVKTHVTECAYQAEAHQTIKTLLVEPHTFVYAKPMMLVDTQHVIQAMHGYTAATYDVQEVWYCTLRGISEEMAHDLMIHGFLLQ